MHRLPPPCAPAHRHHVAMSGARRQAGRGSATPTLPQVSRICHRAVPDPDQHRAGRGATVRGSGESPRRVALITNVLACGA
jgi:hypothetical protein